MISYDFNDFLYIVFVFYADVVFNIGVKYLCVDYSYFLNKSCVFFCCCTVLFDF
jgi:hypothetical protein